MCRYARLAAINLLVLLALLAGCEIAWRVFVPISVREQMEADFARRSLELLEPCARVEARADGPWIVGMHGNGKAVFEVPERPRRGVKRVIVIGESNADDLAEAFKWIAGDDSVEVLNCASPGAALDHIELRATEVLGYAPAVIVVAAGHNLEFRYPMNAERLRRAARTVSSRLVSGLGAILRPLPPPPEQVNPTQQLARFEQLLGNLTQRASVIGAEVVAVTLPTNLFAPRSFFLLGGAEERFYDAVWTYFAETPAAGIARLERLRQDEIRPSWELALGVWKARRGESQPARVHLERAIESLPVSADPFAPPGRDRAPRRVAAAIRGAVPRYGFRLVDAARIVEERAAGGLPGWNEMVDHCHLRATIWEEIAGGMIAQWGGRANPPDRTEQPSRRRTFDNILNSLAPDHDDHPFSATALAVEQWLRQGPDNGVDEVEAFGRQILPGVEPPARRAAAMIGFAWGMWHAGHHELAEEWNGRAIALQASGAWVQRGLFAVAGGDLVTARSAFGESLELDLHRADAALYSARVAAEPAGSR